MADPLLSRCQFCCRTFSSMRGLGQHIKRAHPVERNELIVIPQVRRRWDDEEVSLLAAEELRVRATGFSGNINLRLSQTFPGRSFDAIKCVRARPEYRRLLADRSVLSGHEPPPLVPGPVCDRDDLLPRNAGILSGLRSLYDHIAAGPTTLCIDRLLLIVEEAFSGRRVGVSLFGWVSIHLASGAPSGRPEKPNFGSKFGFQGRETTWRWPSTPVLR